MELEINGKVVELKPTLGFVRAMDKVFKIEQHGLEMGMGVSMAFNAMDSGSIDDLTKVIKAMAGRVTQKQVDEAVEQYAEDNGDLGGLFDGLKDLLETSPLTKKTVEKFKKQGA